MKSKRFIIKELIIPCLGIILVASTFFICFFSHNDISNVSGYPAYSYHTLKIPLNINTATEAELCLLPNIGKSKANNILEYRNQHGDFKTCDELIKVDGIGSATLYKIKPYITVE